MKAAEATSRLKTFLGAEIGRTRRHLQKAGRRNAATPIHDARKSIKKLRAALRLAADMADPEALGAVAVPLREAAHRLSPLRDALVLGKTAQALRRQGEEPLPSPPLPEAAPLLQEARAQLRSAGMALRRLLRLELDPGGLMDGFQRLYHKARRAMRKAQKDRSDESLHAWRRRAKDFYYTLDLLGGPKSYTRTLKLLTEHLGDDHDLAFFAQHHASPAGLKAHRELFERLKTKRDGLQKKAFQLGARIFEKHAGKFAAHLLGSGAGRK